MQGDVAVSEKNGIVDGILPPRSVSGRLHGLVREMSKDAASAKTRTTRRVAWEPNGNVRAINEKARGRRG